MQWVVVSIVYTMMCATSIANYSIEKDVRLECFMLVTLAIASKTAANGRSRSVGDAIGVVVTTTQPFSQPQLGIIRTVIWRGMN
jgi:hypothetical protein